MQTFLNSVFFLLSIFVLIVVIIGVILKKIVKRKWVYYLLLFIIIIFFFLFLILPAMLVPSCIRDRAPGQLTACKSNIKNLGTALEMYATDNGGLFSHDLSALKPKYLLQLPKCPSTDEEYGYTASDDLKIYTVYCSGKDAHKKVRTKKPRIKTGFPQYSSENGLIDK